MTNKRESTAHGPMVPSSIPPRLTIRPRSARGVCVGVVLTLLLITGCAPSTDREVNSFIHAWEASVSSPDYRVQPPDNLEIKSPTATEVDGTTQIVRQDGKITLCLLGDVKVAGMTPTEISRKIESLLQKYYVDPKVSCRVTGQASKKFYVFGEVSMAGAFQYTGRDTLMQVLAVAQPTFTAWRDQIKVIHPSHEDSQRRVLTIDSDRMIKEGKLDQNVLIEEGDIIYVPPTPLAWVAQRVREVLWPVAPIVQTTRSPYDEYDGVSHEAHDYDHGN